MQFYNQLFWVYTRLFLQIQTRLSFYYMGRNQLIGMKVSFSVLQIPINENGIKVDLKEILIEFMIKNSVFGFQKFCQGELGFSLLSP